MKKLADVLSHGAWLKGRENGLELPENPTLDDFKKEAFRIAQLGKELAISGQIAPAYREKFLKTLQKLEEPYLDSKPK